MKDRSELIDEDAAAADEVLDAIVEESLPGSLAEDLGVSDEVKDALVEDVKKDIKKEVAPVKSSEESEKEALVQEVKEAIEADQKKEE